MQAAQDRIEREGVAIIVVSFAEPERLAFYQRLHQWPFVLLADPERRAYSLFGLERLPWYRLFSFFTLRLYFHLLWKGRKLENYGKDDYYQAGGDFLVDRNGVVFFSHRSRDPADRPSVHRILEEIRKLRNQSMTEGSHERGG